MKKAKPSDIFFAHEIQAETDRMLNIGNIMKIKRRQHNLALIDKNRFDNQNKLLNKSIINKTPFEGSSFTKTYNSPRNQSQPSKVKLGSLFVNKKLN